MNRLLTLILPCLCGLWACTGEVSTSDFENTMWISDEGDTLRLYEGNRFTFTQADSAKAIVSQATEPSINADSSIILINHIKPDSTGTWKLNYNNYVDAYIILDNKYDLNISPAILGSTSFEDLGKRITLKDNRKWELLHVYNDDRGEWTWFTQVK